MAQVLADIKGSGPPTENTPGAVGQIYVDTETALRWECIESHHETRYKGVRVFYDWKCRGLDPDFLATDADIEKTRKEAQNKSIAKLVTLPASKWDADTKSQTVMVMGVLADERVQLVISTPRTTSARAYTNAGIALTGRKENMVTFTAETIPTEDIKLYVVRQEIKLSEYITFSSPESFSIMVSSPMWDGTMEYSTDATTWTTWTGESVSAVADDTGLYSLYFRGTGNTIVTYDNDEDDCYQWEISGSNVYCDGNIETLLDYIEAGSGKHPTMANGCYYGMFKNCTSLVTAPDLPATTLANYCYNSMFKNCTSLVTAPDLPATTLAEDCYKYMFQGCTALTQAPDLPATTLAENCYYGMFNDCTSLVTAPDLPATTLANYCYSSMFYDCTSLVTAPDLPATTLANGCYSYMFNDCTSLVTAPDLPATTLAENCYRAMFDGCTSLVTAPDLPATTLANYCYYDMFYGCTSLKLSSTQTEEYTIAYRIPANGVGTTVTNAMTNMFYNTGGTFTGTPAINTTYYLHKDNSIVQ